MVWGFFFGKCTKVLVWGFFVKGLKYLYKYNRNFPLRFSGSAGVVVSNLLSSNSTLAEKLQDILKLAPEASSVFLNATIKPEFVSLNFAVKYLAFSIILIQCCLYM